MVKNLSAAVLAILLSSGFAYAQGNNDFGLGMILGEPTGVSGKLWTGFGSAVDAAAAWSLDENDVFQIHADYLRHNYSLINVKKGRLPLYYGIGGRARFNERHGHDHLGIRIPVGLEYIFQGAPLDLFMEVVPILDVAPATDFDLNAAFGTRYYF